MTRWIVAELGPDVPLHFTAFHPDYKMLDRSPTPPQTLARARAIARRNGVRFAYTGNVHDRSGSSTYCAECGALAIERDWYSLGRYALDDDGGCEACGARLPGVFGGPPGRWGRRRLRVRLRVAD
jgi:pyruvate formate lyase activating enzyme